MTPEEERESKKVLRDKIIALIKENAKESEVDVISAIKIRWTQSGYDLMLTGYSIEYQAKPKRKHYA